jgi:hypothetical protein
MQTKRALKSEFINTDFDKYEAESRHPILGVHPHLAVLAQAVLAKYPQWQLVASQSNQHYNDTDVTPSVSGRLITRFNITEKREEVGYIGWDYSYSRGDQYVIGNDRISQEMERQSHTKTTKIDVAMRHIKKHFSPKTTNEQFTKSIEATKQSLHQKVATHGYQARSTYDTFRGEIGRYIDSNWELFTATLTPEQVLTAAQYKEEKAKLDAVAWIQETANKKLSYDILLRGNEYVIRHNGVVNICTNEAIPQELKMKLGMLKLVAVGEAIENMGYRGTEDCFVVIM